MVRGVSSPGLRPRWSVGEGARACGPDGLRGREPSDNVCQCHHQSLGTRLSSLQEKRHADTYADVHAALRAAGRFGD